jgi:16S rRNA (guanine(966)-N(2))-methyltransferase RsmD
VSAPRLIAGQYGGRVLKTPRGAVTRPTGARVRGALFNILGDLADARVLDLYAGSGALALEALSRGAARAVLVEHDRAALECIRENVEALGVGSRTLVVAGTLPRALANATSAGPFELVLCDPPWADLGVACNVLKRAVSAGCLADNARIVLEHSAKDENPEISGLVARDRRVWGDTAVSLFQRAGG